MPRAVEVGQLLAHILRRIDDPATSVRILMFHPRVAEEAGDVPTVDTRRTTNVAIISKQFEQRAQEAHLVAAHAPASVDVDIKRHDLVLVEVMLCADAPDHFVAERQLVLHEVHEIDEQVLADRTLRMRHQPEPVPEGPASMHEPLVQSTDFAVRVPRIDMNRLARLVTHVDAADDACTHTDDWVAEKPSVWRNLITRTRRYVEREAM